MVSNILSSFPTDLARITTGNGYQTQIKKVFKVEKLPKDVNQNDCPALAYTWINAPQRPFDEETNTFSMFFTIIGYVAIADPNSEGLNQLALAKLYEDVVKLYGENKETTTLTTLDEAGDVTVIDGYPIITENKGWIYIPIKIDYK